MHRSDALDYGIVLKGSMTLLLGSGKLEVLKEGDVIVERGTTHQWLNATDEWCRILCCRLRMYLSPLDVHDC